MKVLIFGKSDIGEGIKQLYPDTINVPKEECDVRDYNQICATLEKYQPVAIVIVLPVYLLLVQFCQQV